MKIDYSSPGSGKTVRLKRWFLAAPEHRGIVVHTHQRAISLILELRRMYEYGGVHAPELPDNFSKRIISFIDYIKGTYQKWWADESYKVVLLC